jgi:hypothetical protein
MMVIDHHDGCQLLAIVMVRYCALQSRWAVWHGSRYKLYDDKRSVRAFCGQYQPVGTLLKCIIIIMLPC